MNCKAIQLRLSAYLDGELTGYDMIEIRNHVNSCAACSNCAEELRTTKKLLCGMPEVEPDPEFIQRLNQAIFSAPKKSPYRPASLALVAGIAFVATLVVSFAGC